MYQLLFGVGTGDVEDVVGHLGHRRVHLVDGVRHRAAQEPPDQLVDAVVERRGEQQSLTTCRGGGQDAGHARQKAQVGHVVGFVEHGDLHRVQADQALPDQILQPARTGDDDVDS